MDIDLIAVWSSGVWCEMQEVDDFLGFMPKEYRLYRVTKRSTTQVPLITEFFREINDNTHKNTEKQTQEKS